MKIYSFWSADTTYFTKFKSLKKARETGELNKACYLETCEEVSRSWFRHLTKTNSDTMILDDELEALLS